LSLPSETWLSVAVWFVIGLAIYFLYGRNHSLLGSVKKAPRPSSGGSPAAGRDL
jgi:basic amino acid/polyamine antiporter, APA family